MIQPEFFQGSKKHCKFVFDTLTAKLKKKRLPAYPNDLPSGLTPLFVSYHKNDDTHDLRGCVGTFSHQETSVLLPKYALVAAFEDDRFGPIQLEEVGSLKVEVSFLTRFESGFQIYDWEMGKHGITINFKEGAKSYGSTYLPHVPPMFSGKEECIKSLIQKSGYRGNWKNVLDKIELERYQSSIVELDYNEYLKM